MILVYNRGFFLQLVHCVMSKQGLYSTVYMIMQLLKDHTYFSLMMKVILNIQQSAITHHSVSVCDLWPSMRRSKVTSVHGSWFNHPFAWRYHYRPTPPPLADYNHLEMSEFLFFFPPLPPPLPRVALARSAALPIWCYTPHRNDVSSCCKTLSFFLELDNDI